MAHAHQLHHGKALVEAAQTVLVAAGEQWTAMRASVFALLSELSRPASAYDIAEAISKRENRRVPANSIYRILDLFVTNNLALRVESANAYVANPHPGCLHDCIFLVCDDCGGTTHVDHDIVARSVRKAAEGVAFVAKRTVIEVRGSCGGCAA